MSTEQLDNQCSYDHALLDVRWREKRQEIIIRDEYKCVICSSTESLEVHHRQYHFFKRVKKYKEPWEYPSNLLITLCKSCHKRGHEQYVVPIKYI